MDRSNSDFTRDIDRELPTLDRSLRVWLRMCTSAVAIGLSSYVLIYAQTNILLKGRHAVVVLLLSFLAFFLRELAVNDLQTRAAKVDFAAVVVFLCVSTGTLAYFFLAYPSLIDRVLMYTRAEYVLAACLVVMAVEVVRRSYGRTLALLVVTSLFYAYFGPILPGLLHHEGLELTRILEINVLTLGGALGFIPQIGATWVAIFLIYGGLLDAYGALNLFKALGAKLSRHARSGVAQFAVIASLLMGTITGVAAANTAITGSFTIPLMKEHGLDADTAGAIESIASTGGQVMPPIMGVSAFLMASILGVSYVRLVQIALLPALLYYLVLATVVHFRSLDQGISHGYDYNTELDTHGAVRDGLPIMVSIAVLVYFLMWRRYGPMQAGVNATAALIAAQFVWTVLKEQRIGPAVRDTLTRTANGLQLGGMTTVRLVSALVGIAIMVEMLQVGGFVQGITFSMLALSQGQLLPLLGLAMGLSLLLGMGTPTIIAYIMVAIIVGPAMTQFGLASIYGHLFVFYFAVLSSITPPFAVACLVACGISGAGFLETCKAAIALAAPIYVLPYAFVIHRNLLVWDVLTPITFALSYVALVAIIVCFVGYPNRRVSILHRIVLLPAAGAVLLTNAATLNVLGGLLSIGTVLHISRARG